MKLIAELQQIESDYKNGAIEITDGLSFSQYELLKTIEYYSNSKYLNGNKDHNGRELPFYNRVNTMVDTAVVATDIDTKDIVVEADNEESYIASFLFNHEIQNWMKETNFAETLNKMGETRARYGGVVIKRVEDDGDMSIESLDWKNVCADPVDIENGVFIEKHYLTPGQLRKKNKIWKSTDDAIELYAKKGYTPTNERIEIWEIEGEFPESYLEEDAESDGDEDYSRQRHFYAVKGNKNVHLYWEKVSKSRYKYLPWKRVAGRSLGRGVVEEGIEAQVWTNDAVQKEQAAFELASKVILKTNSKKVGNNVLTDLDNGSIVYLEDNKDMDSLALLPSALPEFQNMIDKWWRQYEQTTASYDAIRGETPPSGQPYRLQALVSQAGSSHFDYRREEWGIFLKEVFYDWVFPHIKKKLNRKHILGSDFSPEELMKIDEAFSNKVANDYAIDQILNGRSMTMEDYVMARQRATEEVNKTGRRRFIDIPDNFYKDMEAHLSINITGEQKNKMVVMETLSNLLQTVAGNPMVLQDPNMAMLFNKIMEMSGAGVSPLSLSKGGVQQQAGAAQGGQIAPGAPQPLGGDELKSLQPQGTQ